NTRLVSDWSSDVCSSDLQSCSEPIGCGAQAIEGREVRHDLVGTKQPFRIRANLELHYVRVGQRTDRHGEDVVDEVRHRTDIQLRSEERRVGKECRART